MIRIRLTQNQEVLGGSCFVAHFERLMSRLIKSRTPQPPSPANCPAQQFFCFVKIKIKLTSNALVIFFDGYAGVN
jgi:hypothetical protein